MQYIEATDGTNLAVNDYNPEGAEKTVVLVHGWPLSQKMWSYLIPHLLDAGYRVVTFDLRGFGDSDEAVGGYDYERMAMDLDDIANELNLYKFDLIGFSMGGAISVKYMLISSTRVNKLILLDAAAPSYCISENNPHGQPYDSTQELIDRCYKDVPAVNEYFGSIFFDQEHSQPFKNWFQRMSDSASQIGETLSLVALRDEDVFEDLAKIQVPTAIIHGLNDRICSYGMAEIMHEQIPNSTLISVADAGHGAFIDQMDDVTAAIIDFLQE